MKRQPDCNVTHFLVILCFFQTRSGSEHVGVAAFIKSNFKVIVLDTTHTNTFEHFDLHITKPYDIILSVIYRPPDSSHSEFIDNFTAYIDHISRLSSSKTEFLLMGDFNIDLLNAKSFQVNNFVNLMFSGNCCANIIFPNAHHFILSYSD